MPNFRVELDGTQNTIVGDSQAALEAMGFTVLEDVTPAPGVNTEPRTLSKTAFIDHCVTQLGDPATFMALLDTISTHADLNIKYAHERYVAAVEFEKDTATGFFDGLLTATVIDQTQRDSLVGNWPTG